AQNKQRISPPAQQKPAQLQSQQVSEPQLLKPRISPPPNPNYTIVHFSGIPEQSLYEEVKNLAHKFGEVKDGSFQYHEQDDSSEGFAIVDYQTHQVAESAVNSSDEKRLLRGVIVSVQWEPVTQMKKISVTPPCKPKLQPNQLVYIPKKQSPLPNETNTRQYSPPPKPKQYSPPPKPKQYSPPPNTNDKRVHFAGIPVESSEPEVKAFARQFGFYTSFFYKTYDDGRTGFANVEYQTPELAQAAVSSNRLNMLNGKPIHIYWSDHQIDDQKKQNIQDIQEQVDDNDYFESGRNAVLFQGFGISQKRSEMMTYVKRFGPIQKFLSPHMPQTQQQIRDQGFQTALVEYINKEDMERALESSGSDFEGFKLNIYQSTYRGDQNDNKPKAKHPKVDDQKSISKYRKPKPKMIEDVKNNLRLKSQELEQFEGEDEQERQQQKEENSKKQEQRKHIERLDFEGISPIIEFRWLDDSVDEKILRGKIEEYCDENEENIGEIVDLKISQVGVYKSAHIEFESPENATLIFNARKEKKIKFDGELDNDNDSDDDDDDEDDNSDDDDKAILVCYQEPFLKKSEIEKLQKLKKQQKSKYENDREKLLQDIELLKKFLIDIQKEIEADIDPDSKQLIEGIQVRKLRRGTKRWQLEEIFRQYNPIKFIIHFDKMDPRYDFAFIQIQNPDESITAAAENNQTEFCGHIIDVQLKYRFMPSEKFKKWSDDEKNKKPKYLYVFFTNFENDFTLEQFLELLENNHIEAQGGLVTLEVDDPSSCLAVAYILEQKQVDKTIRKVDKSKYGER
ncbi:MAG: hypothetical protein EZS28_027444, partial [Streblomastix strix]